MKKITLSKKNYLVAFVFVMLLNTFLSVFLLHKVFAQKIDSIIENQPPVAAKVLEQKDSPLLLTIINVDNSAVSFQTINFAVQNTSNQSIKGYVIFGNGKNTGKIMTSFFPAKSFQVGSTSRDELNLERINIQPSEILSLSIDYVEFEDGTFWGEDIQGQSEQIAGGRAGVEFAIEQFKNLSDKREIATLTALLDKKLVDIDVPLPNSIQSERWSKGFQEGYKGIVFSLKGQKEKGVEKISEKLDEIRKNNQIERRQKQ